MTSPDDDTAAPPPPSPPPPAAPRGPDAKGSGSAESGPAGSAKVGAPRKEPATSAKPRKKRRWPWFLLAFALIIAGGAAAILLLPRLAQDIPGLARLLPAAQDAEMVDKLLIEVGSLDNMVAALSRRLENQANRLAAMGDETAAQAAALSEFEQRIAALEQQAGALPPQDAAANGAPRSSGLNDGSAAARIDMLTLRLAQLESAFVPLTERAERAAEAAEVQRHLAGEQDRLIAAVAAIEDRLAALEQSSAGDRRGTLIALSFAALRDVANRGRTFTAEFEALRGILEDSNRGELINRLRDIAPFAASGVPTLTILRTGFNDLSSQIIRSAHLPENAAWWQRAWASLRGLIVLRPVGEVKGEGVEAIVARADRRLAGNDLAAAVRELNKLPPAAQGTAQPWLQAAQNRLKLDEALARFANALLRAAAIDGEPGTLPPQEN